MSKLATYRTFALVAIVTLSGTDAIAASRGAVITGTVRRQNTQPVRYAWVVLVEQPRRFFLDFTLRADRRIAAGKTDDDGRFRLPIVRFGGGKLTVAVLGERVRTQIGQTTHVAGTDVAAEVHRRTDPLVIVVPDEFRAARQRPKDI
jgi:hypothetical protein